MDRLTEVELAGRAGTTGEKVRRLEALGILGPDPDGTYGPASVQRVRFAAALEQSGIPLGDIGTLIARGHLSFSFVDLLFPSPAAYTGRTYEQFCAESGLPFELVQAFHEAVGLPLPEPGDPIRDDDAEMFPMAHLAVGLGLEQSALARALRVYGENMRRIAQAEPEFYHAYIEAPLIRSGMTEAEMRATASQISTQLIPTAQRLILWLYRRHFEHYTMEHLVEHVEAALETAGLERPRDTTPPAMAFLDLSGYTALTEERGDEAAAELAVRLAGIVQTESNRHGGRAVKWLGDGVMFHFPQPSGAVRSALQMVERTPDAGLPPAHVGIHAGPVIFRDGDYFGRTVNVASRIADQAGPGQILVSEAVVAATPSEGVRFESMGPIPLKGLSHPLQLYRAMREPRS